MHYMQTFDNLRNLTEDICTDNWLIFVTCHVQLFQVYIEIYVHVFDIHSSQTILFVFYLLSYLGGLACFAYKLSADATGQ